MRKLFKVMASLLLLLSMTPLLGKADNQPTPDVDLWNAVKPLSTTVTFLNTGAHPDDERSDLLAYLSRGLGVKSASVIANRGEGGQNEIGTELGDGLGIIRSNEMIEAAKITGVKAYHLSETTSDPIYDFGFSKSPEETLEKWGEELTYERLIRFIRTYQPDIVMPSFRDVDNQHGHHRAMTILSEQTFEDAADPSVFPEQLDEGLSVWQIKKLYLPAESEDTATTSIEIGDYDPIYQMTYPQLGEASRYLHKSQGMGRDLPAEPRQAHLELIDDAVDTESNGLFAGIPYNLKDWAQLVPQNNLRVHLQKLQNELDDIIDLYPKRGLILPKSQKALIDIQKLITEINKAKMDASLKNDLLHKLELKEEQLQEVSFVSSSLKVETMIDSDVLTQGESTTVSMTITNEGDEMIKHIKPSLLAPKNWQINTNEEINHLKPNESKTVTFNVTIPNDEEYFHPYDESIIQSKIMFKENGAEAETVLELDNTVAVLPEISISSNPVNLMINTADVQVEVPVTVSVKNYFNGENNASVSLDLPEGWTSEPEQVDVSFTERFEEKEVDFSIHPASEVAEGNFSIDVLATSNGNTFDNTVQEIKYDHINDAYFLYSSAINGVAFELLKPDNLKVGYIESGFDTIADDLKNAGFDITKLSEEDLASADLSVYDSIVTGIRANLSRADLVQNNDRLHEYVENGGHLVVQYHKPGDNWDTQTTAPYPLEIGIPSIRWRVTDENAEVTMTQPEHKLFNYPNNITNSDWDNWVQERGLYFPMNWDDRYETFVSMADPGEDPFTSGILMAEYGEGTYLYTNLVFYRQIDNQVPGGYRIFTNLISYGMEDN
ncbi:PIG-L family deacetylase [Sporosarcina sp. Marseille-Q4063]|uniref:NEW3 domain-containing protein n=1 Tax=Sporosarcina sp. Marseille-Q4063 TaxID=2810514 RepID=UPI001BAEF971|nr:NEW3 domain-containing protein [Sporosarcina sp. Marseille-Q4063]QUW22821.1 PIG-L family deacetylase [Sporosarcina sp. Marseille-Q4063]